MADDTAFQAYMSKYGVRNPDDPRHFYDYRGAFNAGVVPQQWSSLPNQDRAEDLRQIQSGLRPPIPTGAYMWPDEHKLSGHPVAPKLPIGRDDMGQVPGYMNMIPGQFPPLQVPPGAGAMVPIPVNPLAPQQGTPDPYLAEQIRIAQMNLAEIQTQQTSGGMPTAMGAMPLPVGLTPQQVPQPTLSIPDIPVPGLTQEEIAGQLLYQAQPMQTQTVREGIAGAADVPLTPLMTETLGAMPPIEARPQDSALLATPGALPGGLAAQHGAMKGQSFADWTQAMMARREDAMAGQLPNVVGPWVDGVEDRRPSTFSQLPPEEKTAMREREVQQRETRRDVFAARREGLTPEQYTPIKEMRGDPGIMGSLAKGADIIAAESLKGRGEMEARASNLANLAAALPHMTDPTAKRKVERSLADLIGGIPGNIPDGKVDEATEREDRVLEQIGPPQVPGAELSEDAVSNALAALRSEYDFSDPQQVAEARKALIASGIRDVDLRAYKKEIGPSAYQRLLGDPSAVRDVPFQARDIKERLPVHMKMLEILLGAPPRSIEPMTFEESMGLLRQG